MLYLGFCLFGLGCGVRFQLVHRGARHYVVKRVVQYLNAQQLGRVQRTILCHTSGATATGMRQLACQRRAETRSSITAICMCAQWLTAVVRLQMTDANVMRVYQGCIHSCCDLNQYN
jgi:hypothetical protein